MSLPHLKTALATLTWFPVLFTTLDHVYQPCQVSGSLMAPTFNPATEHTKKDVVLVQKYNLKLADSLQRGDVIMFHSPLDPGKLMTKRVVGVQGDIIIPRSKSYPRSQALIPRNHLWVEGDNAFHSIDSNDFGPISQGLVVGKVVSVLWPLGRFNVDITKGGRDGRKKDVATLDEL